MWTRLRRISYRIIQRRRGHDAASKCPGHLAVGTLWKAGGHIDGTTPTGSLNQDSVEGMRLRRPSWRRKETTNLLPRLSILLLAQAGINGAPLPLEVLSFV